MSYARFVAFLGAWEWGVVEDVGVEFQVLDKRVRSRSGQSTPEHQGLDNACHLLWQKRVSRRTRFCPEKS